MGDGSNCWPAEPEAEGVVRHRRYLEYLVVFLAFGVLGLLALLYALNASGSLPAPPVTATYCIDEKFKFLAEHDIDDADLIAVGSSVTWRNLDMRPFIARGLAERPVNAAPCYLHMDQVAFFTGFLLDHMHDVETVVSVVAPRDFADCNETDRAFFARERAARYVFEGGSPLPLYFTNLRPISFFRDAIGTAERRRNSATHAPLVMDPYGAGPIVGRTEWTEVPWLDDRCFAALGRFEAMLAARGVRLVVVSFPPSPGWTQRNDPEGALTEDFEARLGEALGEPGTLLAPSERFTYEDALYFDYVHLQWPGAQQFSAAVADWLAAQRHEGQGTANDG
jgi:hypothetical protein